MKKNKQINEEKTSKKDGGFRFSFRTSQSMFEMIKLRIEKLSLDSSKYIKSLVEKDLEEEAKEIRLEQEALKQKAIITKQKYAQLDKTLKHKKGDYSIDEAKEPLVAKENYAPLIALFVIIIAAIIYYLNRFLTRRNEEKAYERRIKLWQSYQNPPPQKVDFGESNKMLDKSVEQD
jgi:hypothetical protein